MSTIEGVVLRQLMRRTDDRGSLTELLRSDWPEFEKFGQAIVTVNVPGVIRGWHWHRRQVDRIVVLQGAARVPLYDGRPESRTYRVLEAHDLDESELFLISIPAGVYHGYKTTSSTPALIVNFPNEVYDHQDPDEERIPHDTPDIPYAW